MPAESSERKIRVLTRGRPFQKGNPGRPKGTKNKATAMLERMFDGEAGHIGRCVVDLAKQGKPHAIKHVLDRACPVQKGRKLQGIKLPTLKTMADALTAMTTISSAVAEGGLTIEDARAMTEIVDSFRKVCELTDIERRITALEKEPIHDSKVAQG